MPGSPVRRPVETMYCIDCRKQLPVGASFCVSCGTGEARRFTASRVAAKRAIQNPIRLHSRRVAFSTVEGRKGG